MTTEDALPTEEPTEYYPILLLDVANALALVNERGDQASRRIAVRTMFAGIEGCIAGLQRHVLKDAVHHSSVVSPAELAVLREEAYVLDNRGRARTRPQYTPLLMKIRFLVDLFQRIHPGLLDPAFEHPGWPRLQSSLAVRNRLTHPRSIEDLSVSEADLEFAFSGFLWVVAIRADTLQISRQRLEEQVSKMKALFPGPFTTADGVLPPRILGYEIREKTL